MKKSTLTKLIVSMICVTMFTACGSRNSKKRSTGVYTGPQAQQSLNDDSASDDGNLQDDNSQEDADTLPTQRPLVDNNGKPVVASEEELTQLETEQTTIDETLEEEKGNPDTSLVVEESTPVVSNTNSQTQQKLIVEEVTSNGETASNKATRKDPLTGLGFYADTPYSTDFIIPESSHTGFSAFRGNAETTEEKAHEVKYTDLVSDNVMSKLKDLFASDINTYSNKNQKFEELSIELSQAINNVYSRVNIKNQTINVTIKIGQKGNVFENNTLDFYGSFNEDGTARLTPTQKSSHFNYVLDVVCLDEVALNCQTQQLVLSYFYKQDDPNGTYKKGLCKRTYMVNRLGHATMNINSNPEQGRPDYIAHYVTNEPYHSRVCDTDAFSNVGNAIVCLADFTYNTLYKALYDKCYSGNSNPACKTQLTNTPRGKYAQTIYLHTFAVAGGKAEYMMSLKDSENKFMSFSGGLFDTNFAVRADIGSYKVDREAMTPSFLTSHISELQLNGIDSQSVMQFKLKYAGLERLSTTENPLDSEMTTDIIQRFPDLNLNQFLTEFNAPAEDELTDLKADRDESKDDDFSTVDKVKNKLKGIFKDDTPKFTTTDYSCDELNAIVKENKTVHLYAKKGWFASSRDVHYDNGNACHFVRTAGNRTKPGRSVWPTTDQKTCNVGVTCVKAEDDN